MLSFLLSLTVLVYLAPAKFDRGKLSMQNKMRTKEELESHYLHDKSCLHESHSVQSINNTNANLLLVLLYCHDGALDGA